MILSSILENRKIKYTLIGVATFFIFLAILIPSVTLRSSPLQPQNEIAFDLPTSTSVVFKPELMERVRQALKETPLIDT